MSTPRTTTETSAPKRPALPSLTGLDASFLYLESEEQPMHVGSLHLYQLPDGFKGSFRDAVRDHIGQRMHLVPIFNRKLAFMPWDLGHPAWVPDPDVDVEAHIVRVGGKKKLSVLEVEDTCAKLHAQLLDRSRPLWTFYCFDSVEVPADACYLPESLEKAAQKAKTPRYAAFYSKIHHATLDGKAGTVLANTILDLQAEPRPVPPPDPERAARAKARAKAVADMRIGEMMGAVFSNALAQYAKIAKTLPQAASQIGSQLGSSITGQLSGQATSLRKTGVRGSVSKVARSVGNAVPKDLLAPKTLFNAQLTNQRVFATATVPFAECREMGKAMGASFNDVALWLCATAMRNYLVERRALPYKSLVAAMPVSLREEGNQDMSTQASMALADLGTATANPAKRLGAIVASTAKVKKGMGQFKSIMPTDFPGLMAPWLVGAAGKAYNAFAARLPAMANVVISNVPGPQVPLYMAGSRMLTFHPLSIIVHGIALNITIQTYAGRVDFGLIADPKAVDDVHGLARGIEAAYDEARGLFATSKSAAAKRGASQKAVSSPPAPPKPNAPKTAAMKSSPKKSPVKARRSVTTETKTRTSRS
jgi:diacylglycerol O-acyltransferase / wax synthase